MGGKQAKGNQFISWIHEEDFARAVAFVIENKLENEINVVSPSPIRNVDFMAKLRKAVGIPFGISQPKWLLEIGSKIINTETELVLKSRNVIPKRLQDNGFIFKYDSVEKTFENLLKK